MKAGGKLEDLYIVNNNNCWLWKGSILKSGYGSVNGTSAHRMMWFIKKGSIPPGLDLDHLCRVRHCVNPDHLEIVTRKVNLNRGLGRIYSEEVYKEVIKLIHIDKLSTRHVSMLTGVSKSRVSQIAREDLLKSITLP